MRKKSNDLMKKVPDITIVSKALTDADSDSDDDKDTQNGDASSVQLQQQRLMRAETDSQGDAPTAIHSTTASQPPESPPAESSAANQMMGLTGSGAVPLLAKSESVESLVSRNGSDGGGAVVTFAATTTAVANNNPASIAGDLEHHDEVGGGNAGGIDNDSKIISTSNAKDGGGDAQSTPKPSKASENEVIFNQIAKLNFVIEGGSLQFRKWRDLTLKTRQQYLVRMGRKETHMRSQTDPPPSLQLDLLSTTNDIALRREAAD